MNTNHEETGITITLRKVGHQVHFGLSLGGASAVEVTLDDSKTVYSALHEAKDALAAGIGEAVTNGLRESLPYDALTGLQVFEPSDAAAVLDGKQVATPVNPAAMLEMLPIDETARTSLRERYGVDDIDAAHEAALAEDAERG